MTALMRKELRELALPAVALVCCAVIIAGMDLMYNLYYPQYKGQGIAVGVWLIISIAVAFLGGASAIARESRARTVFLSEWPVSRGALWVAKAAVSFVLTMAVIAAGFGACLLAAGLAHYEQITDLRDAAVNLAYVLPLCFAFGLLWSGLIGSVLGAGALGFVSAVVLEGGAGWFLMFYAPAQWGPWVGSVQLPDNGPPLLAMMALVLVIGAWTYARYPVLEGKRRVLVGVGLLLAMAVGGIGLLVGYSVVARRPSLEQTVTEAGLSEDGRTIYFSTVGGKEDTVRDAGLWVMPAIGGRPRLVARTGVGDFERVRNLLAFEWKMDKYTRYWKYDFNRKRLRRLPGYLAEASPDGRYVVTMEQRCGTMLSDERGRAVKLPGEHYGAIILDNRAAYYPTQDGRLRTLDLQTRQETELGRVPERACPMAVSPDGKWLALTYRDMKLNRWYTVLVNVQTRVQKRLAQVSAFWAGFVGDRYLWVRERYEEPNSGGPAVVDLETGRVVRRFGGGSSRLWHREGVPYVVFAVEIMEPGPRPGTLQGADIRRVFIANPDGTGARLLREERRQVLGMTAEGRIVMWDRKRTFLSWDPVRGEEKVLVRLP